jgi:L-lactate dehydrogenase complex protein LldG
MSNTRENVLSALRRNVREQYDMPDLSKLQPITFADPVAEFIKKTTTTAGAKLIEMQPGEDINIKVREAYPDAASIACNLPSVVGEASKLCTPSVVGEASKLCIPSEVGEASKLCIPSEVGEASKLCVNPDTATVEELERIDVGVIEGKIGVAENACIWIPQQMKEKAVCFASQRLVIVLRRSDIVNNMHEAYDRIAASSEYFQQYKFGTFISGPSKTADIESALVYGAQAARAVTVVLVNS